jgi:hypothetical protein
MKHVSIELAWQLSGSTTLAMHGLQASQAPLHDTLFDALGCGDQTLLPGVQSVNINA